MLTNSSGHPVWRATSTPFGKASFNNDVDGDGVAVEFNIRQPGQYYDRKSGLYYNYYRYYDPETGRYITSDPIGLVGGINTYVYVYNNPLKYIDPYGLDKFIGWRVNAHNGWWSHYRKTNAVCEVCSGQYREVNALIEQWRPMSINTVPMPGQPGDTGAVDALFDLMEAMKQAKESGSKSMMEKLLDSPAEVGRKFCDATE